MIPIVFKRTAEDARSRLARGVKTSLWRCCFLGVCVSEAAIQDRRCRGTRHLDTIAAIDGGAVTDNWRGPVLTPPPEFLKYPMYFVDVTSSELIGLPHYCSSNCLKCSPLYTSKYLEDIEKIIVHEKISY